MSEILEYVTKILPVVIAAAVTVLAVIAPLTKSSIDNKALDVLRFIEDKILSLIFPSLKNESPEAPAKDNDMAK